VKPKVAAKVMAKGINCKLSRIPYCECLCE